MRVSCAVIQAIAILGSVWWFSSAVSAKFQLYLTGRTATQSSTFRGYKASLAIDGNYNSDFSAMSCSHTDDPPGGTSWWRVDLGKPVKVQQVRIVNRSAYGSSLNNFVVGLSNSSANPVRGYYALCGQYLGPAKDGARLSLQCNPGAPSGRYVIVQQSINGDGKLAICEIEIYAGQVRKLNRWKRLSNQRLMSTNGVSFRKLSSLMCIQICRETIDCDSINYREMDMTCEVNLLPSGADGSRLAIAAGWDIWVQACEFI